MNRIKIASLNSSDTLIDLNGIELKQKGGVTLEQALTDYANGANKLTLVADPIWGNDRLVFDYGYSDDVTQLPVVSFGLNRSSGTTDPRGTD